MKTASLPHPVYHYIDTAPLAARYEVMVAAIMGFIGAGRLGDMLRVSHKVVRLVRAFTKIEAQNILLTRKLEMLSHTHWRDRVLKELGGIRKLKLWEAAQKRILQRIAEREGRSAMDRPAPEPAWLYTPERMAESERLKARARMCMSASVHPNIFRDRYKMDFDGLFRLAPLSREGLYSEGAARQVKVYTQNTIVDYDWNPVPFAKTQGFGPASIWPVEFYAAMKVEAQSDRNCANGTITTERLSRKTSDSKEEWEERKKESLPLIPIHQALSPKVHQDFFGSLLG